MRQILMSVAWLFIAANALAAAAPSRVNFSGQLMENGQLVNGNRQFELRLFDAATGGTVVHTQTENLDIVRGMYHADLTPPPTAWQDENRWLEVAVDGTVLSPRQQVGSVPYARVAEVAETILNPSSPSLFFHDLRNYSGLYSSSWTQLDTIAVNTSTGGIVIMNASGRVRWAGVSNSELEIAIDDITPGAFGVTSLSPNTALSTQLYSISPTVMRTIAPGTYIFKLWVRCPASSTAYDISVRRFQITFLPF